MMVCLRFWLLILSANLLDRVKFLSFFFFLGGGGGGWGLFISIILVNGSKGYFSNLFLGKSDNF